MPASTFKSGTRSQPQPLRLRNSEPLSPWPPPGVLFMAPTIAALSKRLKRLEGDGGGLGSLGPGWWDDWDNDFDLLRDPSWRPYCSLEQFLIGRASMLACLWRLMYSYAYWSRHSDPYWWSHPVWRGKTPDWEKQVDRERRLHCPQENRGSMTSFVDWLYSSAPRGESERPWEWCQPKVGSLYHWPCWRFHMMGLLPTVHALAVASACWLIDDLGMTPQQVQDSASKHVCAFKWRDLPRLAQVQRPNRPITSDSPKLRIAEMTTAAEARGIPVDDERSRQGDGLELLELLMSVASGCGGPHGREMIFPSLPSS